MREAKLKTPRATAPIYGVDVIDGDVRWKRRLLEVILLQNSKEGVRECKRRSQGKGKSAIQIEKPKTRHGACARPTTRGTGRSNTGITTLFDLMLAYACSCTGTGACTHYETLAQRAVFMLILAGLGLSGSMRPDPATSRWSLVTRDFGRALTIFWLQPWGGLRRGESRRDKKARLQAPSSAEWSIHG